MTKSERTTRKAKNLQYIRSSNRAGIFRYLSINGQATRMDLTRYLGLSKMAISNIVNELLEEGLVTETAISESDSIDEGRSAGRKSLFLKIVPERFAAIGIYLSRDNVQAVIADITGNVYQTWKESLELSDEYGAEKNKNLLIYTFAKITESIKNDLQRSWKNMKILGIGLCSIGPLDIKKGLLLDPPNFYGIEMIDIKALLSVQFKMPVWLDNDMNAAAWAEHLYGAARDQQHCIYLGLSNGIGAGIIAYGRIFQGSEGYAGEIGHISINMDGPKCNCGQRGCLEAYLSLPKVFSATKTTSVEALVKKSQKSKVLLKSWQDEYIRALTIGLINIVNTLDPDVVLLGHEGAVLVEKEIATIEKNVNSGIFQRRGKSVHIGISKFRERSPLAGSVSLVFQAVFRGDLEPGGKNV